MKYICLIIVLSSLFPAKMAAQENTDWPDENICIGCSYIRSSLGTKKGMLFYSIKTVREADGIKYSRMYVDFEELSIIKGGTHEMSLLGETTCSDVMTLWEDADKVYCQSVDGKRTWLIFDFGLEVGDTFINGEGKRFTVTQTTTTDKSKRRKLLLVSEDGTQKDTWVEGIGSLQYGYIPAFVVQTMKDFQDLEEPLSVFLWKAEEVAPELKEGLSISQSINDEYLKLLPFQEFTDEDMTYDNLSNPNMTCSFIGDGLWIQGYYPLNLYQSYVASVISGNQVDISFHQVVALDVVKGYRPAKIDVRIPGFKAGTYMVRLPGQEQVRQVCIGVNEPVIFTAGQVATIILPVAPDASKGKYYRLDRVDDGQIIFEEELQPQAHIPYIIVPNEDFCIDPGTLDLEGCYRDTVSIAGISFIGSYVSETFDYPDGFYIDFIDITPDCRFEESCVIGALRAYLLVRWDDPYNQGGTRVPPLNKRGILLRDYETGITSPLRETEEGVIFDLQGRKLQGKPTRGIYIENGNKFQIPK